MNEQHHPPMLIMSFPPNLRDPGTALVPPPFTCDPYTQKKVTTVVSGVPCSNRRIPSRLWVFNFPFLCGTATDRGRSPDHASTAREPGGFGRFRRACAPLSCGVGNPPPNRGYRVPTK
ncbi:hypothetical protein NL676_037012 [Syzygium grande]|nr:hypothetical protein NL676_037012 [Syzygium grande]